MNSRHRAIRAQISVMCEARAIDYIRAFHLPEDEERYIIEREVHKMSIVGIAEKYSTSAETVRNRRRAAFARISDAISYRDEESRG